ncbi:MAG: hypothetical protein UY48_C0003G0050 [Candidatus Gottesmanbacteria bacterium GW2011_GWB1_49_7]|uniref:Uncharacterized protein n=1 Tax=Candidatus Gottesmanbacteria bacterium GW2011_GWB1_49_7 TaxID=1618448 RepID=A0A0G1W3F1_9BACT|nr:MAG: hypothetical protein UY48_C0003G0050 [Candidatus Gottesmanbacteria bacterium GW2011_GWB1_49_7]
MDVLRMKDRNEARKHALLAELKDAELALKKAVLYGEYARAMANLLDDAGSLDDATEATIRESAAHHRVARVQEALRDP